MDLLTIIYLMTLIFIVVYSVYHLVLFIERRWSAKYITAVDFRENMRFAQVIDVREKSEFDAKHILGARNMPLSQFKQYIPQLRKDQPIYLCDDFTLHAGRAAGKLKRAGYKEIYILKGGLEKWNGKFKTKKK